MVNEPNAVFPHVTEESVVVQGTTKHSRLESGNNSLPFNRPTNSAPGLTRGIWDPWAFLDLIPTLVVPSIIFQRANPDSGLVHTLHRPISSEAPHSLRSIPLILLLTTIFSSQLPSPPSQLCRGSRDTTATPTISPLTSKPQSFSQIGRPQNSLLTSHHRVLTTTLILVYHRSTHFTHGQGFSTRTRRAVPQFHNRPSSLPA